MNPSTHSTTQIFLDSGDPADTRAALSALGSLDGQTTNPSLLAKVLEGKTQSASDVLAGYKRIVQEMRGLLTDGQSISIEMNASATSTAEDLFAQAQEMNGWIHGAHIKFPITAAGLEAALLSLKAGMRVNMTLCFTISQALAVHGMALEAGAKHGDVFVSPFLGRLDDAGENGLNLLGSITANYLHLQSPVLTLSASIRSLEAIKGSIALGADIVTIPSSLIPEWAKIQSTPIPLNPAKEVAPATALSNWREYDITHPLTAKGLDRFAQDWNNLITHHDA